jgi:adenylate cyclase class 1
MSIAASLNDDKSVGYQFYPIKKSLDEGYHIDLKSKTPVSANKKYFDIQVIGDIRNMNNDSFHLYCNGVEFSNLEFGNNVLREAVKYILEKRNNGERYPIYITDIDTNEVVNKHDRPIQTVQLLTYKKNIEDQLNQTLRSI